MRKGSQHTEATRAKMRGQRVPRRVCREAGCAKLELAKGWCAAHYSRMYRRGTMTVKPQVAWNKGLKTGLGPWRGKKRGPMSPETRHKMSAAKIGRPKSPEHAAKILGAMWHGPKPTYAGVLMRSSYEVRFATACDVAGVAWQYEPKRFDLGTCSYLPDFYLPLLGIYVEVKGYFSDESRAKVALFRQRHRELPLVVVMKRTLAEMEGAHGGLGVEDQVNGLVAQQCAIDNGVNCREP